jgi:ABC-type transport system substrate-binding protein
VPGFRDSSIYPLRRPNLRRAGELARGNLREGTATLYTASFPPVLAVAQLAKQQLAHIGLDVTIRAFPDHIATASYLTRLVAAGEPWDLALVLWAPNLPDPGAHLSLLLHGRNVGGTNFARFSSRAFDAELQRASRVRRLRLRQRAYGALDIRIAREAAPLAAIRVLVEPTFISKRVGCIVLRPHLNLTGVCLK